eukprot:CAMPEP_0185751916 /NCGR_PEP_ID=MMETSP1174-20130828/10679_1 /TAXON_ID=35687 /ORGANISM="Dictyocha speculum, Strain CCMP1381" /LENGTH=382 /DNA_ID=CAMNT_0028429105 /DNA_START=453 /DNA_END=1598 /DNA_ORIENTATION=-
MGVGMILPPLVVSVFGREAVFGFLARSINSVVFAKDGAFLAELFMNRDFEIGDTIWLPTEDLLPHLMKCKKGTVPDHVHESDWCPGKVKSIDGECGRVSLYGLTVKIDDLCTNETLNEVLDKNPIRCVDWVNLTRESMSSYSWQDEATNNIELSRPLKKGEQIDFFISHSWQDDMVVKWGHIIQCSEAFMQANGRYPTFWIDKFCLSDGRQAREGLRVLCKSITACDKLLILCGPTFPRRMWCAWEIFTLFAFQSESQALERILLITLDAKISPEDVVDSKALWELEHFDVNKATCYDPNDEIAMKKIIDCFGRSEFNGNVRKLASRIREKKWQNKNFMLPQGFQHTCVNNQNELVEYGINSRVTALDLSTSGDDVTVLDYA